MIIQCINCDKKFEVNSSLIPKIGRNIECGSCNHRWFYKSTNKSFTTINVEKNNKTIIDNADSIKTDLNEKINQATLIDNQDLVKKDKFFDSQKNKSSSYLSKILSYIMVSIISFITLIIILDTFKSFLDNSFPGLELLLYNLFETIKDIFLFFKNLFV
jgi:predicted Zn finger-like uncharacterized protein